MNTKFFTSALAATVTVFVGGWVIYGMILMDYMAAHSFMKEAPAMWSIIVGNLFSCLLYAFVCQLGGIKSFGKGMATGAILGGLMGLSTNFLMYGGGMFDSATPMILDTAGIIVLGGLGCGVAGALMGRGESAA